MKLLLGNMERLAAAVGPDDRVTCYQSGSRGSLATLRHVLRAQRYDMVAVNGAPNDLLLFAAWKTLFPFSRFQLVSIDIALPVPNPKGWMDRARLAVKRWLMKRVDAYILYARDGSGYERCYGIDAGKQIFVPFKVNHYEVVRQTRPTDEGYVFCGGKSRRDFATLFKAFERLDYPLVIVSGDNAELGNHESYIDEHRVPDNVTIKRDLEVEEFVNTMARARLVVNPIKPNNITAAGISVILPALALGKCVVMTDCPATRGYLDQDQLVVVPPEDEQTLADQIQRLWEDDAARRQLEERAAAFGAQLSGEAQLYRNIYRELVNLRRGGGQRARHATTDQAEVRPRGWR